MTDVVSRKMRRVIGWETKPLYSCHDLRENGYGPIEAYYRHGGDPCIVRFELANCRWFGASGLAYSSSSLHPYVQTLIDYSKGRCGEYKGSFLEFYWKVWKPENLAEYFGLSTENAHPLLANSPAIHNFFPWSPVRRLLYLENQEWKKDLERFGLCDEKSSPARSCGPKSTSFGEARFGHLINVYESIKVNGYCDRTSPRVRYSKQHIVGNCLVRGRDVRIVVANGQHRAAALVAHGQIVAPIIVHCKNGRGPNIVRREDVNVWPMVQMGLFREDDAVSIFDRIFDAIPPESLRAGTRGFREFEC